MMCEFIIFVVFILGGSCSLAGTWWYKSGLCRKFPTGQHNSLTAYGDGVFLVRTYEKSVQCAQRVIFFFG